MAWNDPFETLVETLVTELGEYLQSKGDLDVYEIARTQEVCRDFCNFVCKDIHKATHQDYTVYHQLHSVKPGDEEDYARMLSLIREYSMATEPAVTPQNGLLNADGRKTKPQSINSVFLVGNASDDSSPGRTKLPVSRDENIAATPQKPVAAVGGITPESEELLSDRVLKFNFPTEDVMPGRSSVQNARGSRPVSTAEKAVSPAVMKTRQSRRTLQTQMSAEELDALISVGAQAELGSGMGSGRGSQYQEKDSLDFNPNDSSAFFQDEEYGDISNSGLISPNGIGSLGLQGDLGGIDNSRTQSDMYNMSSFGERQSNGYGENGTEDAAAPGAEHQEINSQLIKGVSGVAYNFNQGNLMRMREFQSQQDKLDAAAGGSRLMSAEEAGGFRCYYFESKYLIDMPLPDPGEYQRVNPGFSMHYIIPLAPTGILLALSLVGLTLSSVLGSVLLILTVISLIFALPSLSKPVQTTPQAALDAYLSAKQGRCYGKGLQVLAKHCSDDTVADLHKTWEPEENYAKAFLKRFSAVRIPSTRTVTGSESHNKLLLIHSEEDHYWLLPMVRIDNNWYITNPQMVRHELNEDK